MISDSQFWNGVLYTTHLNLSIKKSVKHDGCGILEQYIQLALTNLFNCISFLAFIHTQNASVSLSVFFLLLDLTVFNMCNVLGTYSGDPIISS